MGSGRVKTNFAIPKTVLPLQTRGWPYVAAWVHRGTGVFLAAFVLLHVHTLSSLKDPTLFAEKMRFLQTIMPGWLEWLVGIPVIFHALNGGRLILYEVFHNRNDRLLLRWVVVFSLGYAVLLGLFMYRGDQQVSLGLFWSHMVLAALVAAYLTTVRLRRSKASLAWKTQRLTGSFLLVLMPAHMLFMHLNPAVGRDAALIIARMDTMLIRLLDLTLLLAILFHGAYGIHGICRDYLTTPRSRQFALIAIFAVSAIACWLGVSLLVFLG